MSYAIVYPTGTKDASAKLLRFTLVVSCPFCNRIHHHKKVDRYKAYVESKCGKGYYILRVDTK